jgi:hypothetical protein
MEISLQLAPQLLRAEAAAILVEQYQSQALPRLLTSATVRAAREAIATASCSPQLVKAVPRIDRPLSPDSEALGNIINKEGRFIARKETKWCRIIRKDLHISIKTRNSLKYK